MVSPVSSPVSKMIQRFAGRLRYPQLFFAALVIFLIDLVIPDMIPFIDEILFGLLTVILGLLRPHGSEEEPEEGPREEKNVTPRE